MQASIDGARNRFRLVMMTSFAFILGLYSLVVAVGASQLALRNVGTPVFGGMIVFPKHSGEAEAGRSPEGESSGDGPVDEKQRVA